MTVLRLIRRPEIEQHREVLNRWLKDNGIDPDAVLDNWISTEIVDHQRVIRYQAYKLTVDGKRLIDPDDPTRAWTEELTAPLYVQLFLPEASA